MKVAGARRRHRSIICLMTLYILTTDIFLTIVTAMAELNVRLVRTGVVGVLVTAAGARPGSQEVAG